VVLNFYSVQSHPRSTQRTEVQSVDFMRTANPGDSLPKRATKLAIFGGFAKNCL
jgi:hypothetical protein